LSVDALNLYALLNERLLIPVHAFRNHEPVVMNFRAGRNYPTVTA